MLVLFPISTQTLMQGGGKNYFAPAEAWVGRDLPAVKQLYLTLTSGFFLVAKMLSHQPRNEIFHPSSSSPRLLQRKYESKVLGNSEIQ